MVPDSTFAVLFERDSRRFDQGPESLTLGLMAKYWTVGTVKTRLGASIGMVKSASLHQLFVSHLCRNLCRIGRRRVICVAPDDQRTAIESSLRSLQLDHLWDVAMQGEGDLGQRMKRWFTCYLDGPASRAILIGADCPTLEPELIGHAGNLLGDHDVVLGPAVDGGYYLIGLRGSWASIQSRVDSLLTDIPWSSERVMSISRARCQDAGLSWVELPVREDVDTIRELNNLQAMLSDSCGRNAELKTEIDRILVGSGRDTKPGQRTINQQQ